MVNERAMAPGLLMEGITHRYGREPVLCGLDLDIARGEITCLLGPSGCGKTTSLRVAAGLEPIQEGRVEIAGTEVSRPGHAVPPERRQVGLMFQDYAPIPAQKALLAKSTGNSNWANLRPPIQPIESNKLSALVDSLANQFDMKF